MTLAEFKAAISLTRLSLDGRATHGALLVLVDGEHHIQAAASAGCSRQAIEGAIMAISRAARRCQRCGSKLQQPAK